MESKTDELLHWLEHLWPIISGIAVTIVGGVSLLLANIRKKYVTHRQLSQCKMSVLEHDTEREDKILEEIRLLRKDQKESERLNAEEHKTIIQSNHEQFKEIMDRIIALHSGGNHEG